MVRVTDESIDEYLSATDEETQIDILIAQDLTPSDTAALDRKKVVGFCTVRGGATSVSMPRSLASRTSP